MTAALKLEELTHEACNCSYCFDHYGLKRPTIAIAQPRWVGSRYWNCNEKILVVLLNPGAGASRKDNADEIMYQKLLTFRNTRETSLEEIFADQGNDMKKWGRGRFWNYFVTGIGLNIDEIAFANVAWCATSGNEYPPAMLSTCFEKFTSRLISLLSPSIILLCGSGTRKFHQKIQKLAPDARIIPTMHYAHREGRAAETSEIERVRDALRNSPRA